MTEREEDMISSPSRDVVCSMALDAVCAGWYCDGFPLIVCTTRGELRWAQRIYRVVLVRA